MWKYQLLNLCRSPLSQFFGGVPSYSQKSDTLEKLWHFASFRKIFCFVLHIFASKIAFHGNAAAQIQWKKPLPKLIGIYMQLTYQYIVNSMHILKREPPRKRNKDALCGGVKVCIWILPFYASSSPYGTLGPNAKGRMLEWPSFPSSQQKTRCRFGLVFIVFGWFQSDHVILLPSWN